MPMDASVIFLQVSSLQLRGTLRRQFILHSFALSLSLVICQPLSAASEYCDANPGRSFAAVSFAHQQQAPLDSAAGDKVAITTNQARLGWLAIDQPASSLALGIDMLYTIMDFEGITPMTNGHLHSWGVPVSGHYEKNGSAVSYTVTPTLSVSSNALRNTDLIDSEGMQFNAGIIYEKNQQADLSWIAGLVSDYRFGEQRAYPVAGVCWRPAHDWLVQLALPDLSLRKQFSSGLQLTFFVAPEGNQWHVFSKDEQRSSDFSYNAIATGMSAHWSLTSAIELSLALVKHTRREFSIVLDDNSLIEPNAASSTAVRVSGELVF